jgi:hypothetical protein
MGVLVMIVVPWLLSIVCVWILIIDIQRAHCTHVPGRLYHYTFQEGQSTYSAAHAVPTDSEPMNYMGNLQMNSSVAWSTYRAGVDVTASNTDNGIRMRSVKKICDGLYDAIKTSKNATFYAWFSMTAAQRALPNNNGIITGLGTWTVDAGDISYPCGSSCEGTGGFSISVCSGSLYFHWIVVDDLGVTHCDTSARTLTGDHDNFFVALQVSDGTITVYNSPDTTTPDLHSTSHQMGNFSTWDTDSQLYVGHRLHVDVLADGHPDYYEWSGTILEIGLYNRTLTDLEWNQTITRFPDSAPRTFNLTYNNTFDEKVVTSSTTTIRLSGYDYDNSTLLRGVFMDSFQYVITTLPLYGTLKIDSCSGTLVTSVPFVTTHNVYCYTHTLRQRRSVLFDTFMYSAVDSYDVTGGSSTVSFRLIRSNCHVPGLLFRYTFQEGQYDPSDSAHDCVPTNYMGDLALNSNATIWSAERQGIVMLSNSLDNGHRIRSAKTMNSSGLYQRMAGLKAFSSHVWLNIPTPSSQYPIGLIYGIGTWDSDASIIDTACSLADCTNTSFSFAFCDSAIMVAKVAVYDPDTATTVCNSASMIFSPYTNTDSNDFFFSIEQNADGSLEIWADSLLGGGGGTVGNFSTWPINSQLYIGNRAATFPLGVTEFVEFNGMVLEVDLYDSTPVTDQYTIDLATPPNSIPYASNVTLFAKYGSQSEVPTVLTFDIHDYDDGKVWYGTEFVETNSIRLEQAPTHGSVGLTTAFESTPSSVIYTHDLDGLISNPPNDLFSYDSIDSRGGLSNDIFAAVTAIYLPYTSDHLMYHYMFTEGQQPVSRPNAVPLDSVSTNLMGSLTLRPPAADWESLGTGVKITYTNGDNGARITSTSTSAHGLYNRMAGAQGSAFELWYQRLTTWRAGLIYGLGTWPDNEHATAGEACTPQCRGDFAIYSCLTSSQIYEIKSRVLADGTPQCTQITTTQLPASLFHILVNHNSSGVMELWINGVITNVAHGSPFNYSNWNTSSVIHLGRRIFQGPGNGFVNSEHEFEAFGIALYNRSLSPDEIRGNYFAGLPTAFPRATNGTTNPRDNSTIPITVSWYSPSDYTIVIIRNTTFGALFDGSTRITSSNLPYNLTSNIDTVHYQSSITDKTDYFIFKVCNSDGCSDPAYQTIVLPDGPFPFAVYNRTIHVDYLFPKPISLSFFTGKPSHTYGVIILSLPSYGTLFEDSELGQELVSTPFYLQNGSVATAYISDTVDATDMISYRVHDFTSGRYSNISYITLVTDPIHLPTGSGMLFQYTFEEGQYPVSSPNAVPRDSLPTSHMGNITLYSPAVSWSENHAGIEILRVASYNGSCAISTRTMAHSLYEITKTLNEIAISLWFSSAFIDMTHSGIMYGMGTWLTQGNDTEAIDGCGITCDYTNFAIAKCGSSLRVSVSVMDDDNITHCSVSDLTSLPLGTSFITVSHYADGSDMDVWINGEDGVPDVIVSPVAGSYSGWDPSARIYLGHRYKNGSHVPSEFSGAILEIVMYNDSLSIAEIENIYLFSYPNSVPRVTGAEYTAAFNTTLSIELQTFDADMDGVTGMVKTLPLYGSLFADFDLTIPIDSVPYLLPTDSIGIFYVALEEGLTDAIVFSSIDARGGESDIATITISINGTAPSTGDGTGDGAETGPPISLPPTGIAETGDAGGDGGSSGESDSSSGSSSSSGDDGDLSSSSSSSSSSTGSNVTVASTVAASTELTSTQIMAIVLASSAFVAFGAALAFIKAAPSAEIAIEEAEVLI